MQMERRYLHVESTGVFVDFKKCLLEQISGGKHCVLFPAFLIKAHHYGCAGEVKCRCFHVVRICFF